MMTDRAKKIVDELAQLGVDDLKAIADVAWKEYRHRDTQVARIAAKAFSPGDKVKFIGKGSGKLPAGVNGVVLRVKEKNVLVDFGASFVPGGPAGYGRWNVTATMIEKILEGVR